MSRRRRGFMLVELMLVLSIAAILVRISVPVAATFMLKAHASRVVGDYNTMRAAAYAYFTDHSAWPPDAGPGEVPTGLAPYLPRDFSLTRQRYTLEWERWDGASALGFTGSVAGVSIHTGDAQLAGMVVRMMGGSTPHWTLADRWTFAVESTITPI